jgi:hypothetical protein
LFVESKGNTEFPAPEMYEVRTKTMVVSWSLTAPDFGDSHLSRLKQSMNREHPNGFKVVSLPAQRPLQVLEIRYAA